MGLKRPNSLCFYNIKLLSNNQLKNYFLLSALLRAFQNQQLVVFAISPSQFSYTTKLFSVEQYKNQRIYFFGVVGATAPFLFKMALSIHPCLE